MCIMCPVQGRPTPANMEILRRRLLQSCYIVRHVSQDLFLMEHWGSHCWSFFTLCALWNTKISNQIDWWFWISCRTEEWDMMIMMIMMRVSLVQGIYCKSSSAVLVLHWKTSHTEDTIGQFPFRHKSVFSYYLPDFKPDSFPDGLVAPEFQIFTPTQMISSLSHVICGKTF